MKFARLIFLTVIVAAIPLFAVQAPLSPLANQQNAATPLPLGIEVGLRVLSILASWPVILFVMVAIYRRELRSLLPELARRVTKLPGGIELDATMKLQAFKDAAQSVTEQVKDPAEVDKYLAELTKKVVDATRLTPELRDNEAFSVLWVDDNPLNNRFEAGLLENLGASVSFVPTTEEALAALQQRQFDLVISDVHRVEGGRDTPEAGYELLEKMRSLGIVLPVVFYTTGPRNAQKSKSAFGFATTPSRLLNLVQQSLGRKPIRVEGPKRFS
jgi:CheY-like chemotaxis protein